MSFSPRLSGFEIAEVAAGGSAALLLLGIAGYVLGSFMLMGRHVSARQTGLSLRALLREVWIALWTQPFLPLFYLYGRRMDALFAQRGEEGLAKGQVPIVFVHGYMQNRVGFVGLARALRRAGPTKPTRFCM